MLKKAKAELDAGKADPSKGLAQAVLDSSRQIWLAGLGAFARAQQGGAQVFESLVKQGEGLEAKTRSAATHTAEAARDAAKAKAKEVQAIAGGTWDKLEQVFEKRVERALGRLGVYSAADVQKLAARVDELSAAVNALLKERRGERKRAPAARKKAVAKRAGNK
jgi:poly(hydroxyalkanoate) granule-associated protein